MLTCPFLSPLFLRDENSGRPCLLIIQCDSGHINGDLIACARYRIYDMRAKAKMQSRLLRSRCYNVTHVVIIIHLPVQVANSNFVGFQGDPWVSCHIDELRPSDKSAITLEVAQMVTVRQLFYGRLEYTLPKRQASSCMTFERLANLEEEEKIEKGGERVEVSVVKRTQDDEEIIKVGEIESDIELMDCRKNEYFPEKDPLPVLQPASSALSGSKTFSDAYTQCVRLNSCIQAATSRLQDSTLKKQRATERVHLLVQVIPQKPIFPLGMDCY